MQRREFIAMTGAAALWPLAARAQTSGRVPKVAVLWHAASIGEEQPYFGSLMEGFKELGYGNSRIELDHRFPAEKPELFASLAAELVAAKPDVLIAVGGAAPYAKAASTTVPIVFMYVPDPVASGLVESVRRPGGNATGLTNFSVELTAKRLEFLKEIAPTVSRVGLLVNPAVKITNFYIAQSMAAAPKLGITVQAFTARTLNEIDQAFDAMQQAGMQGVVINAESLFYQAKDIIAKRVRAHSMPSCVWVREMLDAGTLVSYGADQQGIARRVAVYVDRILKGEKPAEMPVEQPAKFQFVINLKHARELGLAVPPSLLARADEVIE